MESGYIRKVEYRSVKEPDQEIDYIIRYYPGPGASESINRIQTHIHRRRIRQKLSTKRSQFDGSYDGKEERTDTKQPLQTTALSVITAHHVELISQLILDFGIAVAKAYELAVTKKAALVLQLEAWPFRDVRPRNRAGWMIQAIENNYGVPSSYLEDRKKQEGRTLSEAAQAAIRACTMCDRTGFRLIRSSQYPNGAMHQCTHDPAVEHGISPNAQNAIENGVMPMNKETDGESPVISHRPRF